MRLCGSGRGKLFSEVNIGGSNLPVVTCVAPGENWDQHCSLWMPISASPTSLMMHGTLPEE